MRRLFRSGITTALAVAAFTTASYASAQDTVPTTDAPSNGTSVTSAPTPGTQQPGVGTQPSTPSGTTTTGQSGHTTVTQTQAQPVPQQGAAVSSTTTTTGAPMVVERPAPVGAESSTTERRRPNVPLITTGGIILGSTYTASAIVSGTSGHQGDNHLWIPIVGPWMDVADRGERTPNDNETFNRVMLVSDGVLQGIGALQIISGLVFTEKVKESEVHEAKAIKPKFNFTPMHVASGAGGAVVGTF